MSTIEVGKKAPPFNLDGTDGKWSLKDADGAAVVLYFYPKDNTSGCTQEGLDFAALNGQFKKAKAMVFGISPDTVASHEKFKAKMAFPFELLSDPDQKVSNLFGVYKEKSMYGRKYMGVERSTFVIDGKGVLRHEWRKVKVKGHAEAVLAAVKEL
jgi:thioredoxin-dependent peroxiredoxin